MKGLIAKEGVVYSIIPLLLGVVFLFLNFRITGIILVLVMFLVALFFRYPDRAVNDADGNIYAPADGRIVCIREEFEDVFCKCAVKRVSIFMNVFNVHINYSPINGEVELVQYRPGKFIDAGKITEQENNEYNFVGISDGTAKIGVRQVAGLIARRIVCNCKKCDKLETGKRFGLIKFGSRVDVFFPKEYFVNVAMGEKVRAGRTVIAKKVEKLKS